MDIQLADFDDLRLAGFLRDHLAELAPTAPPESQHALDINELRADHVRLWVGLIGGDLVATAALATLDAHHAELKSMRILPTLRGRRLGDQLLTHVLADARARGISRVSLETGAQDYFAPARRLYARFGFEVCPPFGTYTEDPNSTFMTLVLHPRPPAP